jgi:hypothetical protein
LAIAGDPDQIGALVVAVFFEEREERAIDGKELQAIG